MKLKALLLSVLTTFIITFLILLPAIVNTSVPNLDLAEINDIVKTISEQWDELQNGGSLPLLGYDVEYAVIHKNGRLIAATKDGLRVTLNDAIQNRDTIVDIMLQSKIVGKVIFQSNYAEIAQQNKAKLLFVVSLTFVVLSIVLIVYILYLYRTLLLPFRKLQGFARHIASGNFDIPLEMDSKHIFGAFTESFDLMREELLRSKENERIANQSKKELVASLSHDIKTPIATIKAVTELMLFTAKKDEDKTQLSIINEKAEQINDLITNIFHATLEELHVLSVSVTEISNHELTEIIQFADYKELVQPFQIPNCLIIADKLRLSQVFDNIISNSYKYANTELSIHAFFEESYLILDIIDYGTGVAKEELPFIMNKYYRGKNTASINGFGLGLYISNYLIEQMSGELYCENLINGFLVRIMLTLAN